MSPGNTRSAPRTRGTGARGFTMLEMVVVLVVAAIILGIASGPMASYNQRISARRAAEVFSRDLMLARANSLRSRETVIVKFAQTSLYYTVRTASGRELAIRRFSEDQKIELSSIDLVLPGDSLVFSSRGVGTLSGATGEATFSAGSVTFLVRFNPMGVSKLSPL